MIDAPASSLVVTGGTIVTSSERWCGDILVENGTISALGRPGSLRGDRVVDATDLVVIPGLVDAHVHVRDPGLTHKEDFGSASAAAAAGGVTTILVMPYDDPLTDRAEILAERARYASERCLVDFGLQGAIGESNAHRVEELAAAGAVSLEVELMDAPLAIGTPSADVLHQILSSAYVAGLPVGVYCQEASIVEARRAAIQGAGRQDLAAHIESENGLGEVLAATVVAVLAESTGAATHLRQVSLRETVDIVTRAKRRGVDLTVEVTPHHLLLDETEALRRGAALKVSPPLRPSVEVTRLAAALRAGLIDIVATDHAPHTREEKQLGERDIWASSGGLAGLETMLPAVLDVCGSLGTLVRCCCEQPAARFGLGHRKGRIRVGYDADLVTLDPDATWRVDPDALLTRAKSSPFEGRTLRGRTRHTIVRGNVVAADGQIVSEPRGQWLRQVSG